MHYQNNMVKLQSNLCMDYNFILLIQFEDTQLTLDIFHIIVNL